LVAAIRSRGDQEFQYVGVWLHLAVFDLICDDTQGQSLGLDRRLLSGCTTVIPGNSGMLPIQWPSASWSSRIMSFTD
jgi:hypothetical protein